jgi:tRNA dimethylallyltransferase
MQPHHRKALVVIGGTGVGKTRLGVQLCQALGGEVINADALQCYTRFPIATAKPSAEELAAVRHHLVGTVDHPETVRAYRDRALLAMEDVWARGKLPVIVGGTLYYVQALVWKSLLDEQDAFQHHAPHAAPKAAPPELPATHEQLALLDPVMAARIHPNDVRKIRRSLEVLQTTGKPHSAGLAEDVPAARLDCQILWLTCRPEAHVARLRSRVEAMLAQGLLDEAREFLRTVPPGEQASQGVFQAMGLRELAPMLARDDGGGGGGGEEQPRRDVAEVREACVQMLVTHHRQYVQRQLKWIRARVLPRQVPVFALDTTAPHEWQRDVLGPALAIAQAFLRPGPGLAGAALPAPANTSRRPGGGTAGREVLRNCDLCGGRPIMGEQAWAAHEQSRAHRRHSKRPKPAAGMATCGAGERGEHPAECS